MADQQMSPATNGPPTQDPYGMSQHLPSNDYGVAPETPEQDTQQQQIEVELRDLAGACLAAAVEKYVKAGEAALGAGNAQQAKDFASGALQLVQAVVLLAPVEHAQQANQTNGTTPLAPKHMPPQVSASFSEQQMAKGTGQ